VGIDGSSISIPSESAIIVWDPVQKVEHFIRRAAFGTSAPDFGHLVPTPTLPKLPLAEVEDGIFAAADAWIRPKTVEKSRWNFEPFYFMFRMGAAPGDSVGAAPGGVNVLHEQKVGGYEVSVLEADDPEALSKWLKDRKYSADPELYSWLTPYVTAKWKITAFKIMQDPASGKLATTKAVRMSFQTDRPFFPYREPERKAEKKAEDKKKPWPAWSGRRLLRVHLVSATRMDGKLGNAAWHAVKWADQLTDEQRKQIATETGIAENDMPAQAWLTTFEDRAEPRPAKEEVYFDPAQDQTPIRPPDIIRYSDIHIPIDCVLVCLALVGLIVFAIVVHRRRKTRLA
jgi:hypothetical protein